MSGPAHGGFGAHEKNTVDEGFGQRNRGELVVRSYPMEDAYCSLGHIFIGWR
jgi:hypothetical protein